MVNQTDKAGRRGNYSGRKPPGGTLCAHPSGGGGGGDRKYAGYDCEEGAGCHSGQSTGATSGHDLIRCTVRGSPTPPRNHCGPRTGLRSVSERVGPEPSTSTTRCVIGRCPGRSTVTMSPTRTESAETCRTSAAEPAGIVGPIDPVRNRTTLTCKQKPPTASTVHTVPRMAATVNSVSPVRSPTRPEARRVIRCRTERPDKMEPRAVRKRSRRGKNVFLTVTGRFR